MGPNGRKRNFHVISQRISDVLVFMWKNMNSKPPTTPGFINIMRISERNLMTQIGSEIANQNITKIFLILIL